MIVKLKSEICLRGPAFTFQYRLHFSQSPIPHQRFSFDDIGKGLFLAFACKRWQQLPILNTKKGNSNQPNIPTQTRPPVVCVKGKIR